MLFSYTLVSSALVALVQAQIPAGISLPACVLSCTLANVANSTCGTLGGVGNLTCLCTNVDFQSNVTACYGFTCNTTDYVAALLYGNSTCAANGTPINITDALNMTMINGTNTTNTTIDPTMPAMTSPIDVSMASTQVGPVRRTVAARAANFVKRQTGAADKSTKLVFGTVGTALIAGAAAALL